MVASYQPHLHYAVLLPARDERINSGKSCRNPRENDKNEGSIGTANDFTESESSNPFQSVGLRNLSICLVVNPGSLARGRLFEAFPVRMSSNI